MNDYIEQFCEVMDSYMISRAGVDDSKYKVDLRKFLPALLSNAFESSTCARDCLNQLANKTNSPEISDLGESFVFCVLCFELLSVLSKIRYR
jgi:hypothetical protein